MTNIILGTTAGVTTSIKQDRKTNECSKNVSTLGNNYHSRNCRSNEEITD